MQLPSHSFIDFRKILLISQKWDHIPKKRPKRDQYHISDQDLASLMTKDVDDCKMDKKTETVGTF